MEHYQLYKNVLPDIHRFWFARKRLQMNREFRQIYFPGFFSAIGLLTGIFWDQQHPPLLQMPPDLEEEPSDENLAV